MGLILNSTHKEKEKKIRLQDDRFYFLINELVNCAPGARSEFYPKNVNAQKRIESLKEEFIKKIYELEQKANLTL